LGNLITKSHTRDWKILNRDQDSGYFLQPNPTKGLEVFVDASFLGDWDPTIAWEDRDTARSCHGYVIMYVNCHIVTKKSQLQTEICLSATEAEYTGLSYALREATSQ
jgi:hypothetical protein